MPDDRREPAIWADDFSDVANYGADPAEVEGWASRFGHGECAVLAGRMHEWTGWTVWELTTWQHFCVRRPDGALVDIYGVFKPEEGGEEHIAGRYGCSADRWVERVPARVCLMEADVRAELDQLLSSPWGLAILPANRRLPSPLHYPDLDLEAED